LFSGVGALAPTSKVPAKWALAPEELLFLNILHLSDYAMPETQFLALQSKEIMFTGIIEHIGTMDSLSLQNTGGRVIIHAPSLASSLAVSHSIAVNGCCLTIVAVDHDRFTADLSAETLQCTSFGAKNGAAQAALQLGARVNLERPLTAGQEFGGHFVLGHVDAVGYVTRLQAEGENWWLGVRVPKDFARYVVSKGSITIDGVSLTVARWNDGVAQVAVIPYTYAHTSLKDRRIGDPVNLEFDVLGKFVERYLENRAENSAPSPKLIVARLQDEGF
jgi:riboflavin synthase